MKSKASLLYLLFLLAHNSLFSQSQAPINIQAQTSALSKIKFENPLTAQAGFFEILLNNQPLPDSINFTLYKEIAVCYGMMHRPDSAIYFLKKALLLGPQKSNPVLLKKMLANFYSMNKNYSSADSCFKKALSLCQELKSDARIKVSVLGDYATHFYNQNNYLKALQLLTEAITLNKSEKKIDSITTILLRNKMAAIYVSTKKYDLAKEPFTENIAWLKNSHKDHFLATNYCGLAEVYLYQKNYQESNNCYTKALNLYIHENNEEYKNYCLMKLAHNQLLSNNTNAGMPFIQKAFSGLKASNSIYTIEAATIYLNILHAIHNNTTANAVIQDATVQKTLLTNYSEFALAYYKATLPFLSASGNTTEVINTYKKILVVQDSVNNEAKRKEILEIEAKYQLTINEENEALLIAKNKILSQDNRLKKIQLIVYLLSSAMLIVILLISVKKYKQISEKKNEALKLKIAENKTLALQAKKDSAEKIEKQIVIDEQKKELLAYIEEVEQLESKIRLATEKNLLEEKNNLTAELNKLKEGKEQMDLFMSKFNSIYPTFSTSLKKAYTNITNSDILFCSLIRMNLLPKDIASIMNIEQASVYKRKHRIAEKMGLMDNEQLNETIFAIK